jgi:3-oxoacyl-[acyl-carrier-protein] synthase II
MRRRVVVTGVGPVTSVGIGREACWPNLLVGRCGTGPVTSFDTIPYGVNRGGEIRDFAAPADLTAFGRASQFAILAARLALEDAGLGRDRIDPLRAAVLLGTTSGEPQFIEQFNDAAVAAPPRSTGSALASAYPCHLIAARVADDAGGWAFALTIPTACSAGNYAIAHALDLLRSQRADIALAGGTDAFSRITYTGFARLGAIAPERCQPFDRERKGMVPGEGASMLVLEPLDAALRRGARIYAEVVGYGLSCDAHHMTGGHPEGLGAARAMEAALRDSGMRQEDIAYISAHGTGTPTNDRVETAAVKRVFGTRAYAIPVSSVKSMIGHTMGAASAIEAAVCALAVADDRIPPTCNLEHRDPDCDLDYVPNQGREHRVAAAMNNSYAFGGNNASVIFRKVEA